MSGGEEAAVLPKGRTRWLKHFFVVLSFVGAFAFPAVAKAGPTIVSINLDDSTADQYQARAMLAQDGLHATFFINSNNIGASSSFMTWNQLTGIGADGNEIAGHTLDHVDLTTVSSTEATRQVCDDRQALISHGFNPVDFAYPYGAENASIESIVSGCGYSSARRAWGICPLGQAVPNCPDGVGGQLSYTTPLPPTSPWRILTVDVMAWNTLADLQQGVTRVEASGGGWATLLFHHVCDGCDPSAGYSVSPAILSAFIDWLQPRSASGTYVRTMQDVVTDHTAPASAISCNGNACSGSYTPSVTVSLSATDAGTAVTAIRYTTDGTDPTATSPLYTGPFTVSTTKTVKYRAWDMVGNVEATKSQLIQVASTVDSTPPSSSIACNGSACSSGWYGAGVSVSLSATDSGSGVSAIRYTTDGSDPTSASPPYLAPFTVPATATVKYRAWDVAGNVEATRTQVIQIDGTAPTVAISSPANGATVGGNVKVVASPSDSQSGVASVAFYVDGSLMGTSTSSPWQMPWNTKKVSSGQHALTAVATDRAGNSRTSPAVTVTVR